MLETEYDWVAACHHRSVCERGHQCRTTVTNSRVSYLAVFAVADTILTRWLVFTAFSFTCPGRKHDLRIVTCKQCILDGILVFEIVSEAWCKKMISVCVGENLFILSCLGRGGRGGLYSGRRGLTIAKVTRIVCNRTFDRGAV